MKIYESAENYLETIYILSKQQSEVRSIDVASETGFTKPSVSRAVKNLRASGHILMDAKGHLILTPLGLQVAEQMYERHQLLSQFLIQIGVTAETALADACRIEHVISEESFAHIKSYMAKMSPETDKNSDT